jgi:hypothetical protein
MDMDHLISLAQGGLGGIATCLFFLRYLMGQLTSVKAELKECEHKHEKMTKAVIALAASDAQISAQEISKMLE